MADKPILFSGPMVRALLEGRKTQTRRVLKPQFPDWVDQAGFSMLTPRGRISGRGIYIDDNGRNHGPAEKFVPLKIDMDDRLWVREAWRADGYAPSETIYRADAPPDVLAATKGIIRWKPGIHMNRARSRITLTVTDVRVQRLQDISEADAIAEGCFADGDSRAWGVFARDCFTDLWNSINGSGAWDANPWVAAYTFTVERRNIDTP